MTVAVPASLSLSRRHLHELHVSSAIPLDVIAERGYRTVTNPRELRALGFADYQCRTPGLLIPLYDVQGHNSRYAIKPDHPRLRNDKPIKYEYPASQPLGLDIPPRCLAMLNDPSVPLWITEGAKKADCAAGLGYCVVNVWGVHSWGRQTDKIHRLYETIMLLPDWDAIPVDGRDIRMGFDSDAWSKPSVRNGLNRLANKQGDRKADVYIIRLPDAPDGSKQGLDDVVATQGASALKELEAAAEPRGYRGMLELIRQQRADLQRCQAENADLRRQLSALAAVRRDSRITSGQYRVVSAIADELGWRHSTGTRGPVECNLGRLADQSGVSPKTVGTYLEQITQAPDSPITKSVLWREVEPGEQHKVILLDTPAQPDASPADILHASLASGALFQTPTSHTPKPTPRCPDHQAAQLVRWEHWAVFDCGCVVPVAQALSNSGVEIAATAAESVAKVNGRNFLLLSEEEEEEDATDPGYVALAGKNGDLLFDPGGCDSLAWDDSEDNGHGDGTVEDGGPRSTTGRAGDTGAHSDTAVDESQNGTDQSEVEAPEMEISADDLAGVSRSTSHDLHFRGRSGPGYRSVLDAGGVSGSAVRRPTAFVGDRREDRPGRSDRQESADGELAPPPRHLRPGCGREPVWPGTNLCDVCYRPDGRAYQRPSDPRAPP
jgi:Domain of unknown function (DUF3854)